MTVPILRLSRFLITSLPGNITDSELASLEERLIKQAGDPLITGVAIDLSEVDVVDSFGCRTLTTIAGVCGACGAPVVITGIQPDVAFSMVQLGLDFRGTDIALDLDEGMVLLRDREKRNGRD